VPPRREHAVPSALTERPQPGVTVVRYDSSPFVAAIQEMHQRAQQLGLRISDIWALLDTTDRTEVREQWLELLCDHADRGGFGWPPELQPATSVSSQQARVDSSSKTAAATGSSYGSGPTAVAPSSKHSSSLVAAAPSSNSSGALAAASNSNSSSASAAALRRHSTCCAEHRRRCACRSRLQ
jgi:hypothetical protein